MAKEYRCRRTFDVRAFGAKGDGKTSTPLLLIRQLMQRCGRGALVFFASR